MVIFKGQEVTLAGKQLEVGIKAPDFNLVATDLSHTTLEDFGDKIKVISVVPSIDTGICDMQTRTFNQKLNGDDIAVITVSMDLPFAQARWCGASGLDHVVTLSDYMNKQFGLDYGVLINEIQLLSRSVFVLSADNTITYVQYLDEIGKEPDYDKVIEAVNKLK